MRAFPCSIAVFAVASAFAGGACAQQTGSPTVSAQSLFNALDVNHDGVISQYEYDGDAVSALIDRNHDKQVSTPEFDPMLGRTVDGRSAGRVQVADRNDDGVMSDDEVRRGVYAQFKLLDLNRDGNLDVGELQAGLNVPIQRP
jgi:Ca2+-binding EF-hand superfamily protein